MESNKEFIARMYIFLQELPEDKKNDYNTLLNFFSYQLKARDIEMVATITAKIIVSLEFTDYIPKRYKDATIQKIENICTSSRYTFALPEVDKKKLQQILGEQKDQRNTDNLKH
jgi:hypothetical protein|tara:strand:- start:769 stop:1110 length:342 start_codon:yes stop_codon:yes gene_type:complete